MHNGQTSLFVNTLSGKHSERTPVWLMRQAGRYLPEYQQLRSQASSFLDLCLNTDMAVEATLQPIRRFNLDAAIIFADILLVPHALGKKLTFVEGEGPQLPPIQNAGELAALDWHAGVLSSVFNAITQVRKTLPPEMALIGFAGAPWTVACYMMSGHRRDGFSSALAAASEDDNEVLSGLMETLHWATLDYVLRQIEAGADVIQLFDSWAGLLHRDYFTQLVVNPTQRLVTAVKERYPHVPIIGFPREARRREYESYAQLTGVDAMGIDQNVNLAFARDVLQKEVVIQGNLDPGLLVKGGVIMRGGAENILAKLSASGSRHVFNLGHGIRPDTPPEHVAELVEYVRSWSGYDKTS